jgi:hypothetical protein
MKFLRYFFGLNFNRRDFAFGASMSSNGCSAISAAKSPKSSTSSAVSSASSILLSFSFGSLTLLVLVASSAEIFLKLQVLRLSFSWHHLWEQILPF